RNPWSQFLFPLSSLAGATWALLADKGAYGIRAKQLPPYELLVLSLITVFEGWSCIRRVPLKRYRFLNAEYSASLWSYLHFDWFTPVIDKGYSEVLEMEDLPEMVDDDRPSVIWGRFSKLLYPNGEESVWAGSPPAVGASVMRLEWKRLPLQAFWGLVSSSLSVIPSFALHEITQYSSDYDKEPIPVPLSVVLCVAALFFCQMIQAHADGQMFKIGRRMGIRAKSGVVSAVFRKAMALDMSRADLGQLMNLVAVDAESILALMVFQFFMWGSVIRLVVCVSLLFRYLGRSALAGMAVLLVTIPINKMLLGLLKKYHFELMKLRDTRMTAVNESMQGVRVIKLFAWEPQFLSKIVSARRAEIARLRVYMLTLATFNVVVKSSATVIGVVTFIVHTKLLGNQLTAAAGFSSLLLFNQLRIPLSALPDTVTYYIQARISFKRLSEFLGDGADDVRCRSALGELSCNRHCAALAPGEILFQNASFAYRSDAAAPLAPTIKCISLKVRPGELVCVYGPTGCGKSSLLLACLGELPCTDGRCALNGNIAYVSQKVWIQNATARDNILFGLPYDAVWYNRVIAACALVADFEQLEAGDMTEIGEKGANLSGGQQQRISLARAVYSGADVMLMDDVLSAVDTHVGKHIFKHCIRGLLKGKTRVLVTHQVGLTSKYADSVVVMSQSGAIQESGRVEDLAASEGRAFTDMLVKASTVATCTGPETVRVDGKEAAVADASTSSTTATTEKGPSGGKIVVAENRELGSPKVSVYMSYLKACGGLCFGLLWLLLSLTWQSLLVAQSFALKSWINEMANGEQFGKGFDVYIIVSLASFGTLLVRTLLICTGSLKASQAVHDELAVRVFRAPMSWFESTPLGRIFNRFSSDIVTLDKDLMNDISGWSDTLLSVVAVVVVIAIALPQLIALMFPIIMLCYYWGSHYLHTSRQLKRLEAVSRSPLYSHVSEAVSGVVMIRAYEAQQRFIEQNEAHNLTLNRSGHLYLWISNYWLTCRIRVMGAVVCGLVGAFLVAEVGKIDGATAGLVINYALQFTISVVFTMRLHAQMEMSVNSIERLDEYCNIDQASSSLKSPTTDGCRPITTPPGEVEFRRLTLQYASNSEPTLHDISFRVKGGSKVGIVGRTGAGKSSIMTALFRLVEASPGSEIVIDGIDISSIGLQDLRRRLAIIPQDPTLFDGTIRTNVDPFGLYTDGQIWQALQECHLEEFVSGTEEKLEHPVTAMGSNLSVGQRQLTCMARALLRRAPVLVMDEATANVDPETDSVIQDTMKEGFCDSTVLCIAHRISSIIYYDKVLVLEAGRVVEYDTPAKLL
ncbi:unnamed protein product, partial [Chrysoparadoxa australica]